MRRFFVALFVGVFSAGSALAQSFAAAGVPQDMASARDYPALFDDLAANGISYFFPTFQYREVPEPLSFGFEGDFLPPCSPDDAAFRALRDSGVRLILPAELLYPDARNMPPLADDPLAQVLECAGSGQVFAVTNYDEAPDKGVPLADVQALYERVKQIAPEMPVVMVHAPIILDKQQYASAAQRAAYLDAVLRYSEYGDIVGFDVYPVPQSLAQIGMPTVEAQLLGEVSTVAAYVQWLVENLPDKRHMMALQGFAFRDMFDPVYLAENFPPGLVESARPPSRTVLAVMLQPARLFDLELVVWWGQAALATADQAPWPDILDLSR